MTRYRMTSSSSLFRISLNVNHMSWICCCLKLYRRRRREMSAWMITRNSDDRQLKPEVAVFLDWPMTNDSYNWPSSSAREIEEKENESVKLPFESKETGSNFQSAHKNLIARELSHACRLSLAFSSLSTHFPHTYLSIQQSWLLSLSLPRSFPLQCR